MSEIINAINNDLLLVSYFIKKNSWAGASKSSFQRILYFAAVFSSVFLPNDKWIYNFSNTFFGPYNNDISPQLNKLLVQGLLTLEERKVYSNRIEEKYQISDKGIETCEKYLCKIENLNAKIQWINLIIKTLSIYGENFLSKLIKEDPNVFYQNQINKNSKLIIDSSSENFSKEFFEFVKSKGKNELKMELQEDQDYLLLFFDILYRKYKGGTA